MYVPRCSAASASKDMSPADDDDTDFVSACDRKTFLEKHHSVKGAEIHRGICVCIYVGICVCVHVPVSSCTYSLVCVDAFAPFRVEGFVATRGCKGDRPPRLGPVLCVSQSRKDASTCKHSPLSLPLLICVHIRLCVYVVY